MSLGANFYNESGDEEMRDAPMGSQTKIILMTVLSLCLTWGQTFFLVCDIKLESLWIQDIPWLSLAFGLKILQKESKQFLGFLYYWWFLTVIRKTLKIVGIP
jgi:hypothetical protein